MFRSIFKAFFYLGLVTIITVIAALYFVPRLLPQDKLRLTIAQFYEAATDKHALIRGAVTIAFIPSIYVEVNDVVLTDRYNPQVKPLVIDRFRVAFGAKDALLSRVALRFYGKVNGQTIAGMTSFPTARKYNAGGTHPVMFQLTHPFPADVRAVVEGSLERINVTDAKITLPHTQGGGAVEGTSIEGRDSFNGAIAFSVLDIDEIAQLAGINAVIEQWFSKKEIAKKSAEIEPEKPEAPASLWSQTELNLEWIKVTRADITLSADKLLYRGVTHENVVTKIEADRNQLSIAINQAKLFGGEGSASAIIDYSYMLPLITTTTTLRDADVGLFLRDVFGVKGLESRGDIIIEANTKGFTPRELIATLQGKGSITLKDGKLKGVDMLAMANPAPEHIQAALYETDKDTIITSASATFSMTQGIIANNDLVVDIPFLRLTGRGTLDLLEMSVKYRVIPLVREEGLGLSAPLSLSGDLLHPTIQPEGAAPAP